MTNELPKKKLFIIVYKIKGLLKENEEPFKRGLLAVDKERARQKFIQDMKKEGVGLGRLTILSIKEEE